MFVIGSPASVVVILSLNSLLPGGDFPVTVDKIPVAFEICWRVWCTRTFILQHLQCCHARHKKSFTNVWAMFCASDSTSLSQVNLLLQLPHRLIENNICHDVEQVRNIRALGSFLTYLIFSVVFCSITPSTITEPINAKNHTGILHITPWMELLATKLNMINLNSESSNLPLPNRNKQLPIC